LKPECLGAFVLAVCQNVLREIVRAQVRYSHLGNRYRGWMTPRIPKRWLWSGSAAKSWTPNCCASFSAMRL
jgi:hypothetical protein